MRLCPVIDLLTYIVIELLMDFPIHGEQDGSSYKPQSGL